MSKWANSVSVDYTEAKRFLAGVKMKHLYWVLLLFAAPLYAEEDISHLFALSLEDLLKVEVRGATLTSQSLQTVPAAVTVFTHKEFNRLGLDTLDELMNLVPGFQSYRSSLVSLDYPFSSRGRRIGNTAAEILIMVDGIRLAGPRNSGSSTLVPKYPLMQVERIEFIRGPGSAVYGSNAMMGVINITTRADVSEVNVGIGSFNRRKAHLLTSKQMGDVSLDLFGHIDMDDGDTYRVQDTFSTNRIGTDDPRDLASFNMKLQWQNTHLNLQHNQFKVEDFYGLDTLSNGFNHQAARLTSLSLQQDFDWQAIYSYVWLSYTRSRWSLAVQLTAPGALPTSSPPSNDALFVSAVFDDYSETRMQWHNDWNITGQSSLQFGIERRHIDAPETIIKNNFDLGDLASGNTPIRYYGSLLATTSLQKESRRDIVGVYGQYQHQLLESTHLTLGGRHDDFSGIGSQLSPRFGLVQVLNDHHSIKLLYGEAFRAPAEDELNLLNNPVLLGNPDLEPETVQTSEIIWVGQWFDTGILLGYFDSRFKNAIVQVESVGTRAYENEDQDPSKGFELELSHELNDSWLLRSTYTHFSDTPELSFREADQLASLMTNYQQGHWNANLFATYHGKQEMPALDSDGSRIRLDDYWLLFAKLQYESAPQRQAYLQVKNLLDKDYSTPPSSTNLTEAVPNRGREILAGFVWNF